MFIDVPIVLHVRVDGIQPDIVRAFVVDETRKHFEPFRREPFTSIGNDGDRKPVFVVSVRETHDPDVQALPPADRGRLHAIQVAITSEDDAAVVQLLIEYYGDPDRRGRAPRHLMGLHNRLLAAIVQRLGNLDPPPPGG